ncbi:unnamed protein product [Adineta steineri]|uniref:G-protein coupled receptors family 1 profile domain-containing protein n=1 Tax=Adineta steineri TaxID=433720 RepID=A0A815AI91_9BILA|nr:unnamed protein product [Adineta steineri]CAF1546563.1 unnamed protein product [Adineta steineri]
MSLTILCFGIIHTIYFTVRFHYTKVLLSNFSCNLITYLRVMITFQLAFALIMVSVYIFGYILYHQKAFFKTKKWFILCIVCQWIMGIALATVIISKNDSNCSYPRWVSIYTMVITIVVCSLISLLVNVRLFIYGHFSFQRMLLNTSFNRIEPIQSIVLNLDNRLNNRLRVNQRHVRLLKHMIYMFLIFVIGWGPFSILMIVNSNMEVSTFTYGFFGIWAEISSVCLVVSLFIYNNKLRQYLAGKIFHGF